ncbi:hypothetical protein A9Q94_19245 [Rhodobacterales bacterium 56_14_T64]|nr:hypothetical protein A9Q94_19245 [Rhodobacterales bacterium 56_14_T64]
MARSKLTVFAAAAAVFAIGTADLVEAKNVNNGRGKPGKNISIGAGNGNAAKPIPPGQIKRYTRGAKLPGDVRFDSISDLSKWKLKPLSGGEKYIKVDNEILRVSDTMKVLAVMGLISELAN